MGIETVSVVFTDLVGSTELISRVGPGRAEAIRWAYFGALRRAVDRYSGREVKNLGDGLMVVFASASDAVASAVAMGREIDAYNRKSEAERLAIRVGVSGGNAGRDGDDYFGVPVVQTARLYAAATATRSW